MATPFDNDGPNLPLRPALRPAEGDEHGSPKCGPTKVVSIAEPEEYIPLSEPPAEETSRRKQFTAKLAKRMTGRPTPSTTSSSRLPTVSQGSTDEPSHTPEMSSVPHHREHKHGLHLHHHLHRHHDDHHDQPQNYEKLLSQVAEWLQAEKAKKAARKSKKPSKELGQGAQDMGTYTSGPKPRTSSQSSDSSAISLEKLQKILEDNMTNSGYDQLPTPSPSLGPKRPSHSGRRRSSMRSLRGFQSSDTEYCDGDAIVPTCDVILDNSKTMACSGGSSMDIPTLSSSSRIEKEKKAWLTFKSEIVRLAHTLRLKGWRKVPLEQGGDIEVERLSGALTNAVYVVSPPKDLPPPRSGSATPKPPPKLLLRIYGPQVEHLIDRENELGILKRLARKRIGPRLLGTFKNGRFEEYFNAQTLTAEDLRVEGTSKQIAKRMRELHDGVELLERERDEGPFVWRNWDKWVDRVEEVVGYLDNQIISGTRGKGERWMEKGFVCGVEWPVFKAAFDKYRKWLVEEYYGGNHNLMDKLVFAHNDTQYGNILRLVPEKTPGSAPSPLLLPQNTHKQLIVIDFEYASANTPGLEFANHFTEWCYNYHSPTTCFACNTSAYPTLAQQETFIRSYVNHRPQFPRASATPKLSSGDHSVGGPGSISAFMLDSRTPSGTELPTRNTYAEEEARCELETERHVKELMKEVRVWRAANSAQWVAWGIVQAEIPELNPPTEDQDDTPKSSVPASPVQADKRPEGTVAEALLQGDSIEEAEELRDGAEEEEEFDYLAYAQERAMFFWGDIIGLGIMKIEELPEDLKGRLKIVDH